MKATWLGGSGLLFENGKVRIYVDAVMGDLSNGRARKSETKPEYFEHSPSVIIVTHAHPESLDLPTLDKLLSNTDGCVTILTSESAYAVIAERYPEHNAVLLSAHSVWNEKGVTFYSVKAEHSDRGAIPSERISPSATTAIFSTTSTCANICSTSLPRSILTVRSTR